MVKEVNVDRIWSIVKKEKQKQFTKLKKRYVKLVTDLEKIIKERNRLEQAGVEFGKPSWKPQVTRGDGTRKKYLRLLYPNGRRKYIGSKADKIKKVMEDVKRGERFRALEKRMLRVESEIKEVIRKIREI